MWMTALRDHGYKGRRIIAGSDFEVTNPKDITVLKVAGLAVEKKVEVKTAPVKLEKVEKFVHGFESKKVELTDAGPAKSGEIEIRDEIPASDDEMTSPPDGRPRRQRKNRYDNNEMTPKK